MKPSEYTVENLVKEFFEHDKEVRSNKLGRFKEDDFSFALALHIICKEIIDLKEVLNGIRQDQQSLEA